MRVEEIVIKSMIELSKSHGFDFGPQITSQTVIYGPTGIDSLGLVSLVFSIEENIFEATQKRIRLINDRAFSMKNSPFKTVSSLSSFIEELLEDVELSA